MEFKKKQAGNRGESLAAKFLRQNKYKILSRNLTSNLGEIDILARQKKDIILVEVKTKSGSEFGEGYEMVNYFKRKKLLLLAKSLQPKYPKSVIRIDVISVDLSKKSSRDKAFYKRC